MKPQPTIGAAGAKVVHVADVRAFLSLEGWKYVGSSRHRHLYRKEPVGPSGGHPPKLIVVPEHSASPNLYRLSDLFQNVPVAREKFDDVAVDEADGLRGADLSFNVYIDPGEADESDIETLFRALNDLNRAAGGVGITVQQVTESPSERTT